MPIVKLSDESIIRSYSFSGVDYKIMVYLPIYTKLLSDLNIALTEQQRNENAAQQRKNQKRQRQGTSIYYAENGTAYGNSGPSMDSLVKDISEIWGQTAEKIGLTTKAIDLLKQISAYTELKDVQTLSISSHREKMPARTLGRVNAHTRTRGNRTIAGSIIFTVMDRKPLYNFMEINEVITDITGALRSEGIQIPQYALADQILPFDIIITANNEMGASAYSVIYGAEIVNDGMTMSIQDILTEDVMQFVATDWEPLLPAGQKHLPKISYKRDANSVLSSRASREVRQRRRLNPFI